MKNIMLLLLAVLLPALFLGNADAMGSMISTQSVLIGKPAPDFTLETLQGQKNFTEFRGGKMAIIFFWATWCPHCREAIKDLNARKDEFAREGITLVVVDVGEARQDVEAYLRNQRIDLNVFLDERSSVSEDYRIIGVPTLYFVDTAGIVRDVQHGLPENYRTLFE